jgi:hypothetical protein
LASGKVGYKTKFTSELPAFMKPSTKSKQDHDLPI